MVQRYKVFTKARAVGRFSDILKPIFLDNNSEGEKETKSPIPDGVKIQIMMNDAKERFKNIFSRTPGHSCICGRREGVGLPRVFWELGSGDGVAHRVRGI